jgi:DNA-binding response OmpR family regulator
MKKILIIEDDRKIAMALGVRLRANGYQTILANDALEGVTMAVKNEPDLIILDIMMPAGGGFSVVERLSTLPAAVTVPVIFITASKKPGLKEKARELGAVCLIEKPFDTEKLLAVVRSTLEESAARHATQL